MTRSPLVAAAVALTLLGGCAYESRTPPVSTTRAGPGPASQMPQSPNSLPDGAATSAPITSPVGNVGTTRVGPRY